MGFISPLSSVDVIFGTRYSLLRTPSTYSRSYYEAAHYLYRDYVFFSVIADDALGHLSQPGKYPPLYQHVGTGIYHGLAGRRRDFVFHLAAGAAYYDEHSKIPHNTTVTQRLILL